jgi:hypothetical protein
MNATDLTRPGRVSTFVLAFLAFLGAALMVTFAPTARAESSTPTVYNDAPGDSGLAPDIQTVAVSDTGGSFTVAITAPGLATDGVDWSAISAHLDTDQNAATGDEYGVDYGFQVSRDGAVMGWGWYIWVDGAWKVLAPSPTMTDSVSGDTYTFTFGSADFGGTTGFNFYLAAGAANYDHHGGLTSVGEDWAPDGDAWWTYAAGQGTVEEPVLQYVPQAGELAGLTGTGAVYVFGADNLWHYLSPQAMEAGHYSWSAITWYGELTGQVGEPIATASPPGVAAPLLQTPVPKPVIDAPFTTPAKPVAGQTFTVSFAVRDPSTGTALTKAAMICDPRVNGVVLRHSEHFKNGIATLSFKIPKTAKGKTLEVHLKMRVGNDVGTTRVTAFHIS